MIEWKIKGLYKANAETIYNEIMSIGETVRPSDVVELARDENTALHNLFTWDDSVAAEHYREHEAGCILRNIVIVNKDETEDDKDKVVVVRAIMSTNERTKEYTTVQRIVTNKDSCSVPDSLSASGRDVRKDTADMSLPKSGRLTNECGGLQV